MIKPTQTIKEFNKVNTKKSTAFIYTKDNQLGDAMGETPRYNSNEVKYSEVNFTKTGSNLQ